MSESLRKAADARFDAALAERGARDPREFYRTVLRELKARDPGAYARAVDHYEHVLIPEVADPGSDPLAAWMAYGRLLAELSAEGDTVEVDATGRRHPHVPPTPDDRLVLHLPHARNQRAILVGLPPDPTTAQRATFDWLVQGRQKLRAAPGSAGAQSSSR